MPCHIGQQSYPDTHVCGLDRVLSRWQRIDEGRCIHEGAWMTWSEYLQRRIHLPLDHIAKGNLPSVDTISSPVIHVLIHIIEVSPVMHVLIHIIEVLRVIHPTCTQYRITWLFYIGCMWVPCARRPHDFVTFEIDRMGVWMVLCGPRRVVCWVITPTHTGNSHTHWYVTHTFVSLTHTLYLPPPLALLPR